MDKKEILERFGFSFRLGGAHMARTIMLDELTNLFNYVNNPNATREEYKRAIIEENCLRKKSGKTCQMDARHLLDLYLFDESFLLFRAFQFFWKRDIEGRPLLALLCAYVRDPILRASAPFILDKNKGDLVTRIDLENYFETIFPGRLKGSLSSTSKNVNSTWTKTGHLTGRAKKYRTQSTPTPGAATYAALLGYLSGARGIELFKTEYISLLDCSFENAIELCENASRRGWAKLKRIEDVIDISFPEIMTEQEMQWIHEQN